MRGFERRDDAFGTAQHFRRVESVFVAAGAVFRAAAIVQPCMLRADRCVVESRRNRMGRRNLSMLVLQDVAAGAVENAWEAACEPCGMLSQRLAPSAGFDSNELHPLILDERMEDSNRIA